MELLDIIMVSRTESVLIIFKGMVLAPVNLKVRLSRFRVELISVWDPQAQQPRT